MKKLILCLITATTLLFSQDICGTTADKTHLDKINEGVELYIQRESYLANLDKQTKVIDVPVVFHVLYNDSINITNNQLNALINHMNKAFGLENLYEVKNLAPAKFEKIAGNMRIKFHVEKIIRVDTKKNVFVRENDSAKYASLGGSNAINTEKYLNIWVCDLKGGLLGYSQFPGGESETDGVVLDYAAAGVCDSCDLIEFAEGDVAVHEIGHWFGLIHIWGDDCFFFHEGCEGTDQVKDTPNQGCPTRGCPNGPISSCGNETMYVNYMDYTNNGCMCMFTKGQVKRARVMIILYRNDLLK